MRELFEAQRFAEIQDLVRWRHFVTELIRRNVGESADKDNCDVFIQLSNLFTDFNAVDARRHPNVQNDNIERLARVDGHADQRHRVHTLLSAKTVPGTVFNRPTR